MINVADALTNTSRYYTYAGSLTTPPCTETVTWFVLHEYAQMSSEQYEAFRHILGNDSGRCRCGTGARFAVPRANTTIDDAEKKKKKKYS